MCLLHREMIIMITKDCLHSLFYYDATEGALYWKRNSKRAGSITDKNYLRVQINKKLYYVHRIVWMFNYGEWPKNEIDHIDHNTFNNRLDNLQDVTHSENLQNQIKAKSQNKIGILGVHYRPDLRKYLAQITVSGEVIYLGLFDDPIDAGNAYLDAKNKYHIYANALGQWLLKG